LVDRDVASVEVLDQHEAMAAALRRSGAAVDVDGRRLLVTGPDPFRSIRDALVETGATLLSLGQRSTSLEDVFLSVGDGE
jgi:hypothetical protein